MKSAEERHKISLAVSVVTYKTSREILNEMLTSLERALTQASLYSPLKYTITLVDNSGNEGGYRSQLANISEGRFETNKIRMIFNENNYGYGAAHNLVINNTIADYYLLMNPDVVIEPDAISNALNYMQANPEVSALGPKVRDKNGKCQYLCKKYPAVMDLFIRGFFPSLGRKLFTSRLNRYECHRIVDEGLISDVELISGCFMFCREGPLKKVGGFCDKYFLYFEDFALSKELSKYGRIVYCPDICISHYGGNAAKKGLRHIWYFLRSAFYFYGDYGYKFW